MSGSKTVVEFNKYKGFTPGKYDVVVVVGVNDTKESKYTQLDLLEERLNTDSEESKENE